MLSTPFQIGGREHFVGVSTGIVLGAAGNDPNELIRDADTARCLELNRTALTVATTLLRPGGSFLAKGFVNQELHTFTLEIKQHFHSVQRTRPEATRQGSSEFYFFAKDFHVIPNN